MVLPFVVEERVRILRLVSDLISSAVIMYLLCSLSVQVSLMYIGVGNANVIYIRSLVCFGNSECFKIRLILPVICKNCQFVITFSPSYDGVHPRKLHVFICTTVLLLSVVLLQVKSEIQYAHLKNCEKRLLTTTS
jgi:hypothetical protein